MGRSRGQPRKIKMRNEVHTRKSQENLTLTPSSSSSLPSSPNQPSASMPDLRLNDAHISSFNAENIPGSTATSVTVRKTRRSKKKIENIPPFSASCSVSSTSNAKEHKKGDVNELKDEISDDGDLCSSSVCSVVDLPSTDNESDSTSAQSSITLRPNNRSQCPSRFNSPLSISLKDESVSDNDIIGPSDLLLFPGSFGTNDPPTPPVQNSTENVLVNEMHSHHNLPKASSKDSLDPGTTSVEVGSMSSHDHDMLPIAAPSNTSAPPHNKKNKRRSNKQAEASISNDSAISSVLPNNKSIDSTTPIVQSVDTNSENDSVDPQWICSEDEGRVPNIQDHSPILVQSYSVETLRSLTAEPTISPTDSTNCGGSVECVDAVDDYTDNFAAAAGRRFSTITDVSESSSFVDSMTSTGSTTLDDIEQSYSPFQWAIIPHTTMKSYQPLVKGTTTTTTARPAMTVGLSGLMLRHTFLIPEKNSNVAYMSFFKMKSSRS